MSEIRTQSPGSEGASVAAVPQVGLGEFVAIIGPSGCGKSTMLRRLVASDLGGRARVGYLPQFGAFQPELSVREVLSCAFRLRCRARFKGESEQAVERVTRVTGLGHLLSRRCGVLSGGELRRLALAEVLLGEPDILLLDELTSGLDPHSEREMMCFLRRLADEHQKTILLVTHATNHLELCDRVLLLNRGRQMFFGTYPELLAAFETSEIADVFESVTRGGAPALGLLPAEAFSFARFGTPRGGHARPGAWEQFAALMARQTTIFLRDRGQLALHIALAVTFPLIVAVFAYKGLPQVRQLTLQLEPNIVKSLAEQLLFLRESFKAASLISGLAMFQVVLLTLVGANNGAREIAKERAVLAKERYAGLSAGAYLGSKFVQIALLSLLQSFWMAWFVKTACGFPGAFHEQFFALFVTTLAMSTTCLAISAGAETAERASLLAIYLVGFQLPLSGAALALPDWLATICRPFIAAYWGWSGFLKTLSETRHYDMVRQTTATVIAPYDLVLFVLSLHVILGLAAAFILVRRVRH